MLIDMESTVKTKIDIDEIGALKLLCKTLYMDFVLDEDTDYFVKEDEHGNRCVYVNVCATDSTGITRYPCAEKIDDRGDLFVALRNVVVNIVPNVLFRSADYIYKSN